jgi:hypothetical protein
VVIHTLGELVATFKVGARALKAENAQLRAENDRLRGRSGTDAAPTGATPTEAAIPLGDDAPRVARSIVAQFLGARVAPPALEAAMLVASELVTTFVLHNSQPDAQDILVRVSLSGERCRVEVEVPGCDRAIAPETWELETDAGAGFDVVRALSERWGVVGAAAGPTRVWAQLPCAASAG